MTEAERLAERLEEKAHNHTQDDIAEWSYMTEAATLLRAQSARIAALEEALRERMERLPPEFETAIYSNLEALYEESSAPKAAQEQEPSAG